MELIKSSYVILEQNTGLQGIYEQIELAGRTCYKSTRPEGQSAKDFVDKMVSSKHYSMLEHGTVYIKVPTEEAGLIRRYRSNPYSKVVVIRFLKEKRAYITTNMRVIYENNWIEDLKYLCYPTKYHSNRITVRFILPIGISREFVRHRVFSFAEQSTRYCNYSKSKFNNELTFIIPPQLESNDELKARWHKSMKDSENTYMYLVNNGWKPQEARGVLPLDTKTELIMTGFVSDWEHFFRLRTSIIAETGNPHPQASELADLLYKEFIERKYIKPLIKIQ